jgi:DNA-directed RNA polymerase subunit RPC12/RpoP
MPKITMDGYRCTRCEHEWVPRAKDEEPKVCPKCKSAYWNTLRRSKVGKRAAKHKVTKTTK